MTTSVKSTRGTSNTNARGSSADRLARRQFLLGKFGDGTTAPCYRCNVALTMDTITVDRVIPGRDGGTYRRDNIRPACGPCNSETGGALARKVHHCVDCKALPEKPTAARLQELNLDGRDVEEYRPSNPRPAPYGGPRSRRCATHQRDRKRADRLKAREKRSEKVYGLRPGVRAELMTLQGGYCPICLRTLDQDSRGRWNRTAHDHDHELARQHDHAENEACEECMRGLTCGWCNTELLARVDLAAARRLVAYYENPPMARLRAAHLKESA